MQAADVTVLEAETPRTVIAGVSAASALDRIARVVGGQRLTCDELHKLLYYAQGISLAWHGRPLFAGDFRAATYGPVLDQLTLLVEDRPKDWRVVLGQHRAEVGESAIACLRDVHSVFGSLGSLGLARAAQSERPWQRARDGLAWDDAETPPLPESFIRDFFGDMIEFGEDIMSDLDIRATPGLPAWSQPFRLATNVKFLGLHPFFDEREARWLRVELGFGATPEDWSATDYSPLRPEPEQHAAWRRG